MQLLSGQIADEELIPRFGPVPCRQMQCVRLRVWSIGTCLVRTISCWKYRPIQHQEMAFDFYQFLWRSNQSRIAPFRQIKILRHASKNKYSPTYIGGCEASPCSRQLPIYFWATPLNLVRHLLCRMLQLISDVFNEHRSHFLCFQNNQKNSGSLFIVSLPGDISFDSVH